MIWIMNAFRRELDGIYDRMEEAGDFPESMSRKKHKDAQEGIRSVDNIRIILQNFGRVL